MEKRLTLMFVCAVLRVMCPVNVKIFSSNHNIKINKDPSKEVEIHGQHFINEDPTKVEIQKIVPHQWRAIQGDL